MEYAVTLAGATVGRLVLYHHDPQRDDNGVDDLLFRARALAAAEGFSLDVDAAAEGSVLEVRDVDRHRGRPAGASATFVPAVSDLAVGVAVATSDPELVAASRPPQSLKDSQRTLAGDLSGAVVVMDVDDDVSAYVRLTSAGVLGVTGGPSSLPIAGITDWIVLPAVAHIERSSGRAAESSRWLAAPVARRRASTRALQA
jgi:hypothetical protein